MKLQRLTMHSLPLRNAKGGLLRGYCRFVWKCWELSGLTGYEERIDRYPYFSLLDSPADSVY